MGPRDAVLDSSGHRAAVVDSTKIRDDISHSMGVKYLGRV